MSLYFIINTSGGYTVESNGNKYLTLASNDKKRSNDKICRTLE